MLWAAGVLVAGLALLTAHNWLHVAWPPVLPSSWWDWLYNALEIGAAALCGARALARRRDRVAWLAVTIGMGFFAAADMYYSLVWGDANVVPFPSVADALSAHEKAIVDELNEVQGAPVDIGGYYHPDESRTSAAMRPSKTLNGVLEGLAR